METSITLDPVMEELGQVRRELRELKERFEEQSSDHGRAPSASAEPNSNDKYEAN